MAAIGPEKRTGNAGVAAPIAFPAMVVAKCIKREALMHTLRSVYYLILISLLVFVPVYASPQAPPSDTKGTPKSVATAAMKTEIAVPAITNPRGESLTFDTNSTEISLAGPTWWSVSVSPDGKQIATAQGNGNKGEVKIWDVEKGKIVHAISEDKGARSVVYSPDGTILAVGCYGGKLRFYKTTDYKLCAEGKDGNVPVINGICFFKNGKYLATADQDKFTRIWDVGVLFAKEKAKEKPSADPIAITTVAILEGHTQAVLALSVSTDGKTILTGGQDKTARCYDVPDPLPAPGAAPVRVKKERLLLEGHNSAVAAVAISPDGQLFASGDWSALVLIRSKDGKQTDSSFRLQSSVRSVAFNSDGKYLVASAGNINPIDAPGEVRVWDVVGKKEVATRSDYPLVVRSALFTPDGKTIASVGPDQALTLWPYAGKDRKRLTSATINFSPQPLQAAAVSPDGSLLAFSGETPSVFIFNRSEERLVAELKGHEDVVPGLAFSPDGKTLATASYDKNIKLWNTETWKEQRTLAGHKGWVFSVAFSPDSKTLVSGSYDKTLRIWNVQSGESKMQLNDHTAGIRSVAFSADGKKLVSGGSDRIVRIWDSAEGKVLLALKGHKKAVRAVAFSPDGNSVASGSEDQTVKLWDAATGKESIAFPEFPEMVTAVSFSPKGQTIAAGTFQGAIALLDPITGRSRQTLRVHNESISTLLFADKGQHIISVAQDRSMRQWSVLKTPIVAPAEAIVSKVGAIAAAASTSDGRFVALGSSNGSINLWDMSKGTQFPCPVHHKTGIAHIAITVGISSGISSVISSVIRIASIDKDGSLLVSSHDGKDSWKGKGSFAAFTPDGKFLAVAEGKEIVLRESATGKEAKRFVGGHDGDVIRFDFSPNGTLLGSAGQDTKVRLWNVESAEKLQVTPAFGNESVIKHLSFSPDGTRIAVSAYGPDQPPPDDMTGNFRPVKDVRVYTVPKAGAAFANPVLFAPQPTDQPITAILWDRNGQLLIMPASDGTVRYNDFVNGSRETQRFRAHDGAVLSAVMVGDAFVTAGEDMALRKWYLPQPSIPPQAARIIGPFRGSPVGAGEFDPSGRYLFASAAWDKLLQVFIQPPQPGTLVFGGSYGGVSSMAISPDGMLLATGHENGELLLWETSTGRRVGRLSGLETWIRGVAFTPDGNSLVAVSQGTEKPEQPGDAVIFDISTQKIRLRFTGPIGHPWEVAVNREGTIAAAPCSDGTIRCWELSSGNLLRTIEAHPKGARTIAFSPDGKILVSGGFDGTVRFWSTRIWEQFHSVEFPNAIPNGIAFTPNGKEVVIATRRNAPPPADRVDCLLYAQRVDDLNSEPREFAKGHAGAAIAVAVLKDGKTVVSGGGRTGELGEIKVWDLPSGKLLGEFRGHSTVVEALAAAPDGRTVISGAWAVGQPGELRQWDAGGFRSIAAVPASTGPYVSSAAASPNGKIVAVGGGNGEVRTFDMSDPTRPIQRQSVLGKHASIGSITFDATGKRFVSSDDKGKVIVWDAEKTVPLKEWQASDKLIVFRAKFTPDGKSVVTAAGLWKDPKIPGELRVWNPETGEETGRFPDQSAAVWDFSFLDGGKTLVSTQAQNGSPGEAAVKVFDYAARTEKRKVNVAGGMRCLAVSPDDQYIAVANHSGDIKLISTRTWRATAMPSHGKVVFRLSFSPDSKLLSSLSEDGSVGIALISDQR